MTVHFPVARLRLNRRLDLLHFGGFELIHGHDPQRIAQRLRLLGRECRCNNGLSALRRGNGGRHAGNENEASSGI